MSFRVEYRKLVRVDLLHLFYLDQGNQSWSAMPAERKARQLNAFDLSACLQVLPTAASVHRMAGQQLVFKRNETGFSVWAKMSADSDDRPLIPLDDDLELTFLVRLTDPQFFNYTDLPMADAGRLYYFSNRRPDSEPLSFPLLGKSGGNSPVTNKFCLSDQGQANELARITAAEKNGLLGLIRLYMKGGNASLNLVQAQGKIAAEAPVFVLQFKNRKTVWRYHFGSDQQVHGTDDVKKESGNARVLITKKEYPLTQTGFISVTLGGKDLPNPGVRLLTPVPSANTIYSEIYL